MERKSYTWFEKERRTKALELAKEQMDKALDTVNLLHSAVEETLNKNNEASMHHIENLLEQEREVDRLRTQVFKELSKGAATFADYREDLMHLVNRLDTLADHVKDAARCVRMLSQSEIPKELWENASSMVSTLVKCAKSLGESIEQIAVDSEKAIAAAKTVDEIEGEIDRIYLETKELFIKYGSQMNSGAIVIFDHLVEFVEHAADMCADTADYIIILTD